MDNYINRIRILRDIKKGQTKEILFLFISFRFSQQNIN